MEFHRTTFKTVPTLSEKLIDLDVQTSKMLKGERENRVAAIDQLSSRISTLETRLSEGIKKQTEDLDGVVLATKRKLDDLNNRFKSVETRTTAIETKSLPNRIEPPSDYCDMPIPVPTELFKRNRKVHSEN